MTFARNGHVLEIHTTRERDTMKTVRWVVELCERRGLARKMPVLASHPDWLPQGCPDAFNGRPGVIIADEIAVGKGGTDRLSEIGFNVVGFNAARRPPRDEDALLYQNMRAWLAAKFREYLVQGWVAIPDDPMLLQELRVYSAFTNQSGKLQCVDKDSLRKVLGRSPDRLDSCLMACCGNETSVDFSRFNVGGLVAF